MVAVARVIVDVNIVSDEVVMAAKKIPLKCHAIVEKNVCLLN